MTKTSDSSGSSGEGVGRFDGLRKEVADEIRKRTEDERRAVRDRLGDQEKALQARRDKGRDKR